MNTDESALIEEKALIVEKNLDMLRLGIEEAQVTSFRLRLLSATRELKHEVVDEALSLGVSCNLLLTKKGCLMPGGF